MARLPRRQALVRAALPGLLPLLAPAPAAAGDVTVFLASATPRDVWGAGYGGAISTTWFRVLSFEGEVARLSGEGEDESMTSFMASAHLAPPIGSLVPYGGLGVGLFRQSRTGDSDTGTLKTLVLGVRLKLGLLVLKGEYRRIDLSGEPLFPLEHRLSIGGGISF